MNNSEKNKVERIRAEYEDHEITKIEQLKNLNRKVYLPGRVLGYTFGTIFALVFGFGFSISMGKLLEGVQWAMPVGYICGAVGLIVMVINPFIVKKINRSRRKKYQSQILALSDEILKEETANQ